MPRSSWWRSRRTGAIAVVLCVLASWTCEQNTAGPGRRASLAVAVLLPPADLAAFNLSIDNARLIVVRPPADTVFDETFSFPANQSSLPISADVPLDQSPETFQVTIQLLSGTTLLFEGTQDVTLTSGQSSPPAQIPVTYSGPGQNVATLTIDPADSALSFGGSLTFRPTALDAQGNAVTSFYVSWTTSDMVAAPIDATGTLVAPTQRRSVTVTAKTPNDVQASTPITFTPIPLSLGVLSGCGQAGPPGTPLPQPIVAQVLAADGLGVKGVMVTFAPPSGGGVSPAQALTDDAGLAQTTATLGSTPGAASFSISAPGLTTVSCGETVQSQATQLVFSAQPTGSVSAGTPFTIVVTAQDGQGATATSFTGTVTLGIGNNPGGGALTGTTTAAAVNGVATFSSLSLVRAGIGYSLVASATGLPAATSAAFDIVPAAPAQLVFSVPPASVQVGSPITPPVVVAAQDAFGNATPSFTGTVNLAIGNNPGGAVLGGPTGVAAVAGTATFGGLSLDAVGNGYTLTAAASGLSGATSAAFNVTAVAGLHLAFTTQPSNVSAGGVIAPAVVVTAQDGQNNTVTSFTGPITLAFGTCPIGATLSGTTTVSASAGAASFGNLSIDKAGGCTLVASSPTLQNVASNAFTVSPGAPAQLAFTVQPPPTVAAGALLSPAVRVEIEDALGNPIPTASDPVTIGFDANPGGATLGGTLTRAAASGVAIFTDLTVSLAGNGYSLVATSGALASATSNTFDVTAGAVAHLAVTVTPGSVVAGTTATIAVTAQDGSGATVNGYLGTVHFTSSDPQAALPGDYTFTAGDNGTRTFTNGVTLKTVGTRSVTATDAADGSITGTQSVSVAPATAAALFFTVPPSTTSIGTAITPPVEVTARDAFGNTATGFSANVSLAIGNNPGGATLGGTTTVAASAGIATFPGLTLNQAGTGYTLTAAAGGLTGAISAPFDITLVGGAPNAWLAGGGGQWSVAGNWSLGRVPQATDSVVISLGGTYTVTLDTTINIAFLTFGAPSGVQTLALAGRTLTVDNAVTVATGSVAAASGGTLAGAAALTNHGTLTIGPATINTALVNQGLLVVHGASTVNGAFTTAGGSTLRIEGTGSQGTGALTLAGGFTNIGAIELTNNSVNQAATLTVGGTLTNAGTIDILAGGGARTLAAQLNNQAAGTMTLNQALTLTQAGAAHTNSGTINVSGADWTLSQSGGAPSFTNTGNITIAATRTWTISGGTLNLSAGTVGGAGTLALNSLTANMATGFNNATTSLVVTGSTLNGPGTLTNAAGRTLTLTTSTVGSSMPLANQGLLVIHGATAMNGTFTTAGGSTLRIEGTGSQGTGALTLANGFTNTGAIELTNNSVNQAASLTVTSGTLANAATIDVLAGGGARTLAAQLDNQAGGTVTLNQAFTLSKAGAAHSNGGTINVSGADWTLSQTGTTPSFTNTGAITIGATRTWSITGGTVNFSAGTVGGAGTLTLNSLTANFANGFSNTTTSLVVTSSTLNGPGTLTNAVGQTLTLTTSTIGASMPLVNQGVLVIHGANSINGSFTIASNSTLRIEGTGSQGTGALTVASGFTNNGLIELTNNSINQAASLTVSTGTLANAATINVLAGGGARTLAAQLNNQASGALTVNQALTLSQAGAAHTNAGTIDVSGADWTLSQTGTTPSFTNTGTITIAATRTWSITGGTVNLSAGTVGGAGTLALGSLTANFAIAFSNATTSLVVTSSTLNGPGALTNATGQTLTLTTSTIGATMPLVNQGLLVIHGANNVTGSFTTVSGSTLRIEGTGAQGTGALTLPSGFTNNGLIELTNNSLNQPASLTVTSGTLVNAATIDVLGSGGARTLAVQLNNQSGGTLTVNQALTLSQAGAAHTNGGTIIVGGADWTLSQSGGAPSFTNTGAITIGAARAWTVNNGTRNLSAGSVGGGGTLTLNSVTANFATSFSNATTSLAVNNSTLNGPGTLTSAVGRILPLTSSTIGATMPLVNQGTIVIHGANFINGSVTTAGGSTLRMEGTGSQGTGALTVANGFTNNGVIELTNNSLNQPAALTVGGTLTNAAMINVLGGGGTRVLSAALDNQATGTMTVSQALLMNEPAAGHVNSGLIKLTGGDLTVQFSSGRPGISNFGTIDVGANKMVVGGPSSTFINQNSGTLMGSGTFDVAGASFITNGTTVVGNSPGILNFVGPYTQGPGTPLASVLKVEIGGDPLKPGVDFDQMRVTDNINIQGGTLDVTLIGSVTGQTYVLMEVPAGKTISGDFQTKIGLAGPKCLSGVSGTQYLIVCP